MNPDDAVLLRTYANEAVAGIVASRLESEDITVFVRKDDCGGAYPALQMSRGVQLLVKPEDQERAEEILTEMETEDREGADREEDWTSVDQEEDREESKSVESRPGSMLRGGLYFLLGLAIGYLLSYVPTSTSSNTGTIRRDWRDGKPGQIAHYVDGVPTRVEEDRNYDGKPDAWHRYETGSIRSSSYDDYFHGNPNRWIEFKDPFNCVGKVDTDADGKPDATHYYVDGLLQRVDWHPHASSTIERRELYKHGLLREELVDTDKDGMFDMKITYDSFQRPIDKANCRIPN